MAGEAARRALDVDVAGVVAALAVVGATVVVGLVVVFVDLEGEGELEALPGWRIGPAVLLRS